MKPPDHFWEGCRASVVFMEARHSIFEAHLMDIEKLYKVKPGILLWFARTSKKLLRYIGDALWAEMLQSFLGININL